MITSDDSGRTIQEHKFSSISCQIKLLVVHMEIKVLKPFLRLVLIFAFLALIILCASKVESGRAVLKNIGRNAQECDCFDE